MPYVELEVRKVCPKCGTEFTMHLFIEALEWYVDREHINQREHLCVRCWESKDV